MSLKKKKLRLWDLIVYIFNFFRDRKKQKDIDHEKLAEKLKQEYKKVDEQKEENKKEDVKDRINNIF